MSQLKLDVIKDGDTKEREETEMQVLKRVLKKIVPNSNGITLREAILWKIATKAATGDIAAARLILSYDMGLPSKSNNDGGEDIVFVNNINQNIDE